MSNKSVVADWFGPHFASLHPTLRDLHSDGGLLEGPVSISFGRGLAGLFGRRIAKKLGVPHSPGTHSLQVRMYCEDGAMQWDRSFNRSSTFKSRFTPVGHYPAGHWIEQSGMLRLALGLRITDKAWHWEHFATWVCGIPVPKFMGPRATAYKEIAGDKYRFRVEVRSPLLGKLLQYEGLVDATPLSSPSEIAASLRSSQ